ncbi:binding-protein-dependent transport systems inner membrane component [Beutenbergia cavernae DSM 12333]|uniref:Binding-protein-dependent transport systems inner membrane component n=1 Tax=Beutenbergia cavernae (strain ATCC BAA-8 / DSM 12333 / CCUG 43141 / JCM 11478 / NBRC 16432 / NCIMB 13614 / HKI 0122) TaxID=471853 RepID=C5C390_BEUC1|nr:sugar ABC transporter permease [Beutenbergia cavernae]ACQ79789.1 binding-protein-dependent transport systems inner membrane component [Beutenbergia cavernae DSM 12333]
MSVPTAPAAAARATRPARRPRPPARARSEARAGYLFLLPWFVGLAALVIGPMAASAYLSFTSYDLFNDPVWVGFDNYRTMFTDDPRHLQSLRVTFTYVLASVPLRLAVALGLAVLMNRTLRGMSFYRAALYLPSLLGGSVAIAILWRQLFGGEGAINQILAFLGISGPNWIASPSTSLLTLIVLAVWQFGSPMVIFLAGLRQIPAELLEAARVDGAGTVRRFASVTLPLLTPLVFFNLVMQTIVAFQAFTPSFIISNGTGGPVDSTLFYTLYLYIKGFGEFEMGYASAMAWVLVAIIATFTAINFLGARRWVHYADES